MENVFDNKKDLSVGMRVFSCAFGDEKVGGDAADGESSSSCTEELDNQVADENLIRYLFNEQINIKVGTVRFIGTLKNHPHPNKTFYGIEWDKKKDGKNFGDFNNDVYFYPLHLLTKEKTKRYYNLDDHTLGIPIERDKKLVGELGTCKELLKPCSFMPLEKIHVGLTFFQALHFRYTYFFTDSDLYVEDYQTKKTKRVQFSGITEARKYFQNFYQLTNITLNKYLIYTCGGDDKIMFHKLRSLSLCGNLISQWKDIFHIISLARELSYLNVSDNKMLKLNLESVQRVYPCGNLRDCHGGCQCGHDSEDKEGQHQESTIDAGGNPLICSHCMQDNLIRFEQIKELCIDNTMIEWEDVLILSFVFPNMETLSLKKNYLTRISMSDIDLVKSPVLLQYVQSGRREKGTPSETHNRFPLHCQAQQGEPTVGSYVSMDARENTPTNVVTTVGEENEGYIHTFMKLHKIVLNDNYLHDYEDLFSFIHQVKSIRAVFVKRNKFTDRDDLVTVAERVCSLTGKEDMRDKEVEQSVEDGGENPPHDRLQRIKEKFSHLKELLLDDNKIMNYKTLRDLFYIFYHLETLNYQKGKNNIKVKKDLRFILVAILPMLKTLNRSYINKNERINSERFFISLYQKDDVVRVFNEAVLGCRHSDRLESMHYEALQGEIAYDIHPGRTFSVYLFALFLHLRYTTYALALHHLCTCVTPLMHLLYTTSALALHHFFTCFTPLLHLRYTASTPFCPLADQPSVETSKGMQSNLINITIIPEFINSKKYEIVKKKVNKHMNIKDLKYLCSRLYSVPLPKMQLFYTDEVGHTR
eukprot:XP_002257557.1 hypothetical protein, conserved in Plasmodium species [Plasmodium knowlesi strain H]